MTSKRVRSSSINIERSNQEALHVRNKSTIAALNDLMKDVALVKHRKTLDEVAKAMTRALESDQKWSVKCQELQAELAANEKKVKAAMQLSEEDKNVIDTLRTELQNAWNVIEEMKVWNGKEAKQQCIGNGDANSFDIGRNIVENDLDSQLEDKYKLISEIEKGKLQIFELEEELANKEKIVEELTSNLKLKSKLLEDTEYKNTKLKTALEERDILDHKLQNTTVMLNKKIQADMDLKHNQILKEQIALKKELHDSNKKDKISLLKLKHFINKNKLLSRNLQLTKNQNNLSRVQLIEQTRMLHLLSDQCCKLEDKNKIQSATITQLKSLRDKYVSMIGNLEQKIFDMKKEKRMLKHA